VELDWHDGRVMQVSIVKVKMYEGGCGSGFSG
jgi:hypothetical protein